MGSGKGEAGLQRPGVLHQSQPFCQSKHDSPRSRCLGQGRAALRPGNGQSLRMCTGKLALTGASIPCPGEVPPLLPSTLSPAMCDGPLHPPTKTALSPTCLPETVGLAAPAAAGPLQPAPRGIPRASHGMHLRPH